MILFFLFFFLNSNHTDFLNTCYNNGNNPIFVWITYHMNTPYHYLTSYTEPPDCISPEW